jgi:phage anti-repressor protein/predicted GIY-YIG superfamily endonuclease
MNLNTLKNKLKNAMPDIVPGYIDIMAETLLYDGGCNIDYYLFGDFLGLEKSDAKKILIDKSYNFIVNIDYTFQKKERGDGKTTEKVYVSTDCFKALCLLSGTEKGSKLRNEYIKMENYFKKLLKSPKEIVRKIDFDINEFIGKRVLYLIHITNNIYKFGITYDILRRLERHRFLLNYDYVIKCWDCKNKSIAHNVEKKIKRYNANKKINTTYNEQSELVKTDNIESIVSMYDEYVNEAIRDDYIKCIGHDRYIKLKKLQELNKIIENVINNENITIGSDTMNFVKIGMDNFICKDIVKTTKPKIKIV